MSTKRLKRIPLCLALSLISSLVGCAPGMPVAGPAGSSMSQSNAGVKGEIVLPYRVQDTQVSSLPNPISYFFGSPANADEVSVYVVPVTRTDLSQIRAYVNGQLVSLRVTDMRISGDQTVLSYQIDNLPVLNPNGVHLLEIRLASGEPLLGGVLTLVPGTVNTYNITVQTTALLDSVRETLGSRPITEITIIRVRELERSPGLNGRLNAIRAILQRHGKLRYTTLNRFVLDDIDFRDLDDDDCDRADIKYKEKKGKVDLSVKCKD